MTTARRAILMLLQLAVLYAVSACLSIFSPDVFLLRFSSTFFLLICSLALLPVFSDHIIDGETRRYLVGTAWLITLWILLRGGKYIAFQETETVARHIWYLFYVPALLIPLLSLFAALSVGGRRREEGRRLRRFAAAVTVLLILGVLTNDLHQLAFRFAPGFARWDTAYAHGPLFAAVCVWASLLFAGTLLVLLSRCRVSASRRLIWVPLLPAAFLAAYLVLYDLGLWPRIRGTLAGELPEAVCFSAAGIWLSVILIGLIPANMSYGKLFAVSGLAAQIADRDCRVIYRSPGAVPLTLRQMTAGETLYLDRNTRVHRKPVRGGYVFWQDDVTELNRVHEELREVGERLTEEAELVRLENELKRERARLEARSRVYDEIAGKVQEPSRRIGELCAEAERRPEVYPRNMKLVCLLAAYVKRYANLSLLAADRADLEESELHLAVAESLRYVSDMGIPAESSCPVSAPVPAGRLLEAYALFQTLLEQTLPGLKGVQAVIRDRELRLVLEGASPVLPEGCGAAMLAEDGAAYVRIPLGEAGEAA